MRLARLLALAVAINVLTLAGCGGGGGGNAAPGGGDTAAPTVSITAPASGTTVTGVTTITATAVDNVGVSRVDFYANGTTLLGTDSTEPYSFSWDTSTYNHGSYTLSAKAFDAAGNQGQSANVVVTVPITVSMNTVITGTTAVGTIRLAGFTTANPFGIDMKIAPAGSIISPSLTRLDQSSQFNPTLDNDAVTIHFVGLDGVNSGPIIRVDFSNVPPGTVPSDFGITLLAVYELGTLVQ